ncbi:MAG: hypothetical protein ABS68_00175 [Niastella sp. SCN 39-18]|nr:hypothetical protein [Sphingobacteriales bacterium]ODT55169.1 MAG: hypothetical protein ABS68_00175 [Niastella sp. SCN 39-18]OJW09119.1 MAG: hypothetical protein BGO53_00230 [Sphingobacteriales bacterium 39-19]
MNSPFANLYESILQRIKALVPEVRYINQDMGQLENYELRPAVSWPCLLIDVDDFKYSQVQGNTTQMAEGIVTLRLGLVQYTQSDNLVPDNIRPNALAYYEVEEKITQALHGWAPTGWSRLMREKSGTEKRDDDIRVRVLQLSCACTYTVEKIKTKVETPDQVITANLNRGT